MSESMDLGLHFVENVCQLWKLLNIISCYIQTHSKSNRRV